MLPHYRHFTKEELQCPHCGECHMDVDFMNYVSTLKERCGFTFHVVKGYVCPEATRDSSGAPIEAPEAHLAGKALDIRVTGKRAWLLLKEALAMNFVGIGVHQTGNPETDYIHIDMWLEGVDRPVVWSG